MTPTPTVACILVNWNNFPDTSACLASLLAEDYPTLRILVVDNGSTDSSLAQLRAAHPPLPGRLDYIAHPSNAGFPRACNLGAAHPLALSADFLWMLNNDTIVPAGTARKLIDCAAANPRAGVIGAILYFVHDPTRVQAWGGGQISRWTAYNTHFFAPADFGPKQSGPIPYITFASALIPRQCFDQLGGLFEGAFMYFEDADFCLRAQAAGWQLAVASNTAILHREGGTVKARSPQTDRIVTTSGLAFLHRHSPVPLFSCGLFLALRLAKRILRADWPSFAAILRGFREWRNRPDVVR